MIVRLLFILAFAALVFSPLGRYFLRSPGPEFFIGHIIPFLMVPLPLIFALLKRTVPLEGPRGQHQAERIRSLSRELWAGTAVGLGIVVLTQIRLHDFRLLAWLVPCLVLESLFARPLIQAKTPSLESDSYMPEIERAASLTPRHKSGAPPRWAWFLAWGIWTIAALHCLSLLVSSTSWVRIENAFGFLCSACLPLILGPFALHWWLQCPEPMDQAGNPALAGLYERLRRIKGWGLFGLVLEWVALFSAMAILSGSRKGSHIAVVASLGMAALAITSGSLVLVCKLGRKKTATLLRKLVAETATASRA